jgi:hypothetical protein
LKKDLDNGTEVDFDKIKTKIFITKEWKYGIGSKYKIFR